MRNFDELFKLLPKRGDSDRSWTVDFNVRQQKALEEARPYREKATESTAQVRSLEDELRENRKVKTASATKLAQLEEQWRNAEKAARESQAKAESIEDAVYDLKAVNPNRTSQKTSAPPSNSWTLLPQKAVKPTPRLGV